MMNCSGDIFSDFVTIGQSGNLSRLCQFWALFLVFPCALNQVVLLKLCWFKFKSGANRFSLKFLTRLFALQTYGQSLRKCNTCFGLRGVDFHKLLLRNKKDFGTCSWDGDASSKTPRMVLVSNLELYQSTNHPCRWVDYPFNLRVLFQIQRKGICLYYSDQASRNNRAFK